MKVTVIIENKTYKENLLEQYGLSLLIETNGSIVLMDAGSDESAYTNFNHLGFSAENINAIVISHNHFDHFGGAPFFIENCSSKVYISCEADNDYYTKSLLHRRKMVSRTDVIRKYFNRFEFVEDQIEVLPGVYVCRIKEPNRDFFCKDHRLKSMKNNKLISDDFSHEVYLAVIEGESCKIVSSCSHNGIVNIINDATRRFPEFSLDAFVGGLHMRGRKSKTLNCSKKQAEQVFSIVENSTLKKIYTGHCTGKKAYNLLKNYNIETQYFSTGDSFVL